MESNGTKQARKRPSDFFLTGTFKSASRMQAIDISKYGVFFFSMATIAFGVLNFVYGDFVMGRAPVWPSVIPGQHVWAYASGFIFVILGTAIVFRKNAVAAAILIAMMVFVWALVRHILAGHWNWGAEITQTGKALVLFGGALCTATFLRKDSQSTVLPHWFFLIAKLSLALFFVLCGIEHFMFVEFVKTLVPVWIPGKEFWAWFTGVALIAGGIGMMIDRTALIASLLSGIMVLVWFLVLHIPRAIMSRGDGNEWVAVFEALAVSGIAFMIAGKTSR